MGNHLSSFLGHIVKCHAKNFHCTSVSHGQFKNGLKTMDWRPISSVGPTLQLLITFWVYGCVDLFLIWWCEKLLFSAEHWWERVDTENICIIRDVLLCIVFIVMRVVFVRSCSEESDDLTGNKCGDRGLHEKVAAQRCRPHGWPVCKNAQNDAQSKPAERQEEGLSQSCQWSLQQWEGFSIWQHLWCRRGSVEQ